MAVGTLAVILRELAERTFRLAHAGQQAAFDHDLGVGRDAQIVRPAFDDRQRPSVQRAGDFKLIGIDRRDRLRGEQRQRIDADDDRDRKGLPPRSAISKNMKVLARQQQHAQPVRRAQLAAMDRDVLLAGARVARDHQAGRDVGPAVVLVMGRERQEALEIERADARPPARARIPPRTESDASAASWKRASIRRADAHRLRHPAAVGDEPGDDRDRDGRRAREQRCPLAVKSFGDRPPARTSAPTSGRSTASRSRAAR